MKTLYNVLLGSLLAVALLSCTGKNEGKDDPKQRLTQYISKSFAVKGVEDRQELAGYLAGDAKTRLLAWSEDQFRQAFIDSKRQFIKLAFREIKPVSSKEVNLTYELTYIDPTKGQSVKVTNKKLCQMVFDQGKWFINDVHNIKELLEYSNEMSLP